MALYKKMFTPMIYISILLFSLNDFLRMISCFQSLHNYFYIFWPQNTSVGLNDSPLLVYLQGESNTKGFL